jgi:hypothetical protein
MLLRLVYLIRCDMLDPSSFGTCLFLLRLLLGLTFSSDFLARTTRLALDCKARVDDGIPGTGGVTRGLRVSA